MSYFFMRRRGALPYCLVSDDRKLLSKKNALYGALIGGQTRFPLTFEVLKISMHFQKIQNPLKTH